jgi:peptide deformylase
MVLVKILKFPDKALLTPCVEVTQFGPELMVILKAMLFTMLKANGIGLAANQVGLNIRAIMVLDGQDRYPMMNPEIIQKSQHMSSLEEGCLSAPGERLLTGNRHEWVNVKYHNEDGIIKTHLFGGISSVCVQHEMEHLQGKAFFQAKTISKVKRQAICKRWGLK